MPMPTTFSRFFGCDPGVHGAVACIIPTVATLAWDLSGDPVGIEEEIGKYTVLGVTSCAGAVELPMTVPKQSTHSAQKLGIIIGYVIMAFTCHSIETVTVDPRKWKRRVFFGQPEGKGVLDKKASRALAERLYPGVDLGKRKDEGRSEALLIAHWRRMQVTDA